jgi:phosphoenolpyruvate carboxylase
MSINPYSARERIPATIATQNPDNAGRPFFSDSEYLATTDDVKDAVASYADLGCQEFLWAWEGKFVDESIIDRFYTDYEPYFRKNQPGKDVFLTFYLPKIWRENKTRAEKTYKTMISSSYAAEDYKMHPTPLFEAVIPLSTNSDRLMHVAKEFNETAAKVIDETRRENHLKFISLIPLVDDMRSMVLFDKSLTEFLERYQTGFRCKINHLRPFISRRDLAIREGFIASTIYTKLALCESQNFARKNDIKMHPILGVGTSLFYGGLAPDSIHRFLTEYGGARTVTITPSFRYYHGLGEAKSAIKKLNEQVPRSRLQMLDPLTAAECNKIAKTFSQHHKQTMKALSPAILSFAGNIPARREREGADGLPDRTITKDKDDREREDETEPLVSLGVKLSATLYSLGIPPEFVGTGRGLFDTIKQNRTKTLKKTFPTLNEQLLEAGGYLNKENLAILCSMDESWKEVRRDITLAEDYLGQTLGSKTTREILHRNYTSNILHLWIAKQDFQEDLLKAARLRKFLG